MCSSELTPAECPERLLTCAVLWVKCSHTAFLGSSLKSCLHRQSGGRSLMYRGQCPAPLPRPVCGCGSRDPTVCVLSLCFPAACGPDVSHRVGLWLHIRQILFRVLVSLPGPGTGTPRAVLRAPKGSGPWSRALGPLWVVVPSARAGMEHGGPGGSALETGLRRTLMTEGGGLPTPFPRLTRNLAVPTAVHATPFPFLKPGARARAPLPGRGSIAQHPPPSLLPQAASPLHLRAFARALASAWGPVLHHLPG